MLSNEELERIRQTSLDCPSKNIGRKLKNLLVEHEYAKICPPFLPLSHHRQFINYNTNEQILRQIIIVAKNSKTILLDTESTPIYRQPNRPSLIQLQLMSDDELPIVLLVEVNYLPSTDSNKFKLIKELFRIVLDSKKSIVTWGKIDELKPFIRFNLFDINQIYLPNNDDLQNRFKQHWRQYHPHCGETECACEGCLGKGPADAWKLLDAVGRQLHEWLNKKYTCSNFDAGLDPTLQKLTTEQVKHRNNLTNYAANDVLAMQKLIISMQSQLPPQRKFQETIENNSYVPNKDTSSTYAVGTQPTTLLINSATFTIDSLERTNRNSHTNQFNEEERRKSRNRTRTIKQRQRNFKYEIIRRNIDARLSITAVKEILQRFDVPYTALIISKSRITRRSSLYIGIADPAMLNEYEHRTQRLFTTEFYEGLQAIRRLRIGNRQIN